MKEEKVLLRIILTFTFLIALITFPVAFSSLTGGVGPSGVIGSNTTTLYPIADAHVDQGSPNTNYGSNTKLMIKFDSQMCFTYIMFDLTSINPKATLLYAALRVYAGSGSWTGPWGNVKVGAHHSSDNTWGENELNWNNKPSFEAESTDETTFGMMASEGYTIWNVTKDLKAAFSNGRMTEVLKFDSGDHGEMGFTSREATNKPMLIVEYTTEPIYIIHVESIQDTGNTSNLGHLNISGSVFSLPNIALVVPGSYEASYEGGYTFVRWETVQGATVTDQSSQSTEARFSGNGTLRVVGNAETVHYTYDDGSAETSTLEEMGEIVAIRFTPFFKGELGEVSFYISDISHNASENIIKVHVFDASRKDVVAPFSRAVSEGWVLIDLSTYYIEVNSSFYVGLEFEADHFPRVGIDNSVGSDRNVRWDGTKWFEKSDYNGYMIRAEVKSSLPLTLISEPPPEESTQPIPPVIYAVTAAIATLVVGALIFRLRRRSIAKKEI